MNIALFIIILAVKSCAIFTMAIFPFLVFLRVLIDRQLTMTQRLGWLCYLVVLPPIAAIRYAFTYENGVLNDCAIMSTWILFFTVVGIGLLTMQGYIIWR